MAAKEVPKEAGLDRIFGTLNPHWESPTDVERNGWKLKAFRVLSALQSVHLPLKFEEESFNPATLRLRRRPCDGFTLRSREANRFEVEKPHYFKHPYQLNKKGGLFKDNIDLIFKLAFDDFFSLDYLFPLSSIIQVVRKQSMAPLIARCWEFESQIKALYKNAKLQLDDPQRTILEGGCICNEPPSLDFLKARPNYYLIFRSMVGHEIGHYWWGQLGEDRPEALQDIRSEQVEQVVSLFSIFLIMYKGFWQRTDLTEAQIRKAIKILDFETDDMARHEDQIVARLLNLEMPPRTFQPGNLDFDAHKLVDKDCELRDEAILAIRDQAKAHAEQALHLPLSSAAALINHRKIDSFITFKEGSDGFFNWRAVDRTAKHLDSQVTPSQWREYQIHVPDTENFEPSVPYFLKTARHLAEIRLFGDRFGKGLNFMRSEDVERECDAHSRDQARLLALLFYKFEGNKRKRQFSPKLARFLLKEDPSGLKDLLPDADYYFQWCTEDKDCPVAEERFLGKAFSVDHYVHFDFWGQDGKNYQTSLPWEQFEAKGFSKEGLMANETFKLFGIDEGSSEWRLIPFPL